MANRFGPTRGELWFRLVVSVGGLALVGVLVALHGIPSGPGLIEVLAIPLLLFGGTLVFSARKLIRRDHPDAPKG
jgi:hypothetical protein